MDNHINLFCFCFVDNWSWVFQTARKRIKLLFRKKNKNGSIELQIPQSATPGVQYISIYKGSSPIKTLTITVVDCASGDPSNKESLYVKGDTIDVFGGDTYICKYSYRTTSFDYPLNRLIKGPNALYSEDTTTADDYIFGDIPLDIKTGKSGEYPVMSLGANTGEELSNEEKRKAIIQNERNWSWGNYDLFSTLFQVIVESDDNLNYRHSGDVGKGVSESNSILSAYNSIQKIFFNNLAYYS